MACMSSLKVGKDIRNETEREKLSKYKQDSNVCIEVPGI